MDRNAPDIPRTRDVDPVLIAQAVRVGPFPMPPFGTAQVFDDELDDLVAFLTEQPTTRRLRHGDPTRVAAFAWPMLLTAAMLVVCWWIMRPVRTPDADPPEQEGQR